MTEVQKILTMIETVDTNDTAVLKDIDRRVECYVLHDYLEYNEEDGGVCVKDYDYKNLPKCPDLKTKFTTSRDDLKAIRPDGWQFDNLCVSFLTKYECLSSKFGTYSSRRISSPSLPNEELAELHAIIQSIEFDRGQK